MRKINSLLLVLAFLFGVNAKMNAQFAPEAGKQYMIKNVTHDKYLDTNGQQAILSDKNALSTSQRFTFEALTGDYEGSFWVKQVSSGNFLRRSGGSTFNSDVQGQAYFTTFDTWTDNFPITLEDAEIEGQYKMRSMYSGTAATVTDRYFFLHEEKQWVRSWCLEENADVWSIEEAPETVLPTQLEEAVQTVETFLATINPSSDIPADAETEQLLGQYGYLAYTALQTALTDANQYLDDNTEYYAVDVVTHTDALNAAFDAFKASRNIPIVSDTAEDPNRLVSGAYYIMVGDSYLTAPDEVLNNARKQVRLADKNTANAKDNQVWSVSYNQGFDSPARYTLVTCTEGSTWSDDSEEGLGHMSEGGALMEGNTSVAQSNTDNNHQWRNFSIYFDGTNYCFWNLRPSGNGGNFSFIINESGIDDSEYRNPTGEKYFLFKLVPYNGGSVNIDNAVNENAVSVKGGKGEIILSGVDAKDKVEVYNMAGVLMKAGQVDGTVSVDKGIYVVKVTGATNTVAKVIVQ